MYYDNKEIHAKNIVSGCVVLSEHCTGILNARSIGKEHLNVFITERFMEKATSSKKVEKEPPEVFYKKLFLKISQYSQENTCVRASFDKVKNRIQHWCFPVNIEKFF